MKRRKTGRRRGMAYYALAALCAVVFLVSCAYIISWYSAKERIKEAGEHYRELYRATATPEAEAELLPTPRPTEPPAATLPPPATETPAPTPIPTPTPSPEAAAGEAASAAPSVPAPEIPQKFLSLLAINPDAVGYLEIPGLLSLPVAWRQDDNAFYMTHSFDGRESAEGSLFLDGDNRLGVDGNYIVYGHNMKNDTMFGPLDEYGGLNGVRKYPVVQFDTVHGDGSYVLVGAFHASVNPDAENYFNVRRFLLDEASYSQYASEIVARSKFYIPVGAQFGDRLLVLVTCSGGEDDRRMIVVFREIRDGEDPEELTGLIRSESFRYQGRE